MKIFTVCLLLLISTFASAQISTGGIPKGLEDATISQTPLPELSYPLPDWNAAMQQYTATAARGVTQPLLIGQFAPLDIRFPESGHFYYSADGSLMWRTKISIAGAPAIGFCYDNFELPKGVRYYLINENGKQILGAYTMANNSETDRHFVNEAVQGDIVTLELDIDRSARTEDIKLHINKAMVYFNSVEYLQRYKYDRQAKPTEGDPDIFHMEGKSSHCMINAVCPESEGYENQRKSTVQLIIPMGAGIGACSGTMINNTGNTTEHCKPYLLTASHCENTGTGYSDSSFSEWLIRFNFEKDLCTGGEPATVNTLTGANFKARSPFSATGPDIDSTPDFLLIELRNSIPAAWDAYLSGWDRNPSLSTGVENYVGFHHPAGDVKKLSYTPMASTLNDYYWVMNFPGDGSGGGIAPGSSGSGIFNTEHKFMGIASLAANPFGECGATDLGSLGPLDTLFLTAGIYTRLNGAWDYDAPESAPLSAWLDPAGSGTMSTDDLSASCTATGIIAPSGSLADNIHIYPTPCTDGKVQVSINLKERHNITTAVFNLAGQKVAAFNLGTVSNGSYTLDLGNQANGLYLISFTNGSEQITKKIVLAR